ncbi:probable L-type lectin-domain containing receptor kinase vi.1 [Phtheirospermum japonicum]|uniref:Probable L-type lectin-domain containing receptor kinase vi.1 n=1 Tax=Phtheirospermum japonicum TaxID=374723 RepID=A0A830CYN3_9LAMI|nr:probable L-type lectin-domain containing receptor kinase vi.1 [Phtheirospermum japonicum]
MANPKFLILLILSFSSLLLSSQSIEFTYNGFNNSNLVQSGATAVIPNGALRLTDKSRNVTGHAFHPDPIPISTNTSSFSTYFFFQISPSRPNNGGYGLAFVLSPRPEFDNPSDGQFLGVFNPSNNREPSNHILMVEFDTVSGYNETTDTTGNHVGININGMNTQASRHAAYHDNATQDHFEDFRMETDLPIQAWIDYDGLNQVVNVTVAPRDIRKPDRPLLSYRVDLSPYLLPNMYAGFSAATGRISSAHYILGWSFSLNGTASQLILSQLPVVPAETFSNPTSDILKIALIATFSVVLFLLIVALISTLFYRRLMSFEVLEDWELDSPHRFRHRDLYKATRGFKESEKIGSGGFGSVYKGVLPSTGVEIAVKKIASNNQLQGIREFAAEIESLGRLRHKNLVNLQGWCKYKNDLLLVYDYVPNGSLDTLLSTLPQFPKWKVSNLGSKVQRSQGGRVGATVLARGVGASSDPPRREVEQCFDRQRYERPVRGLRASEVVRSREERVHDERGRDDRVHRPELTRTESSLYIFFNIRVRDIATRGGVRAGAGRVRGGPECDIGGLGGGVYGEWEYI